MAKHHELTDWQAAHALGFRSDTDPATDPANDVQPNAPWVEVDGSDAPVAFHVRNAANTAWDTLVTSTGTGVSSVFGRTGAVVAASGDYAVADVTGAAPLASPTFTGTPAAPTAAGGTNTTQVATTAYVQGELAAKAPLASPTFTGTPAAPTASAGTSTTQLATTAFVATAVSNAGSILTANTQTASYVLVLSDAGKVIEMNVASGNTLTVPPNSSVAFATGTMIEVHQYGAGQVTLTPGVGVTIRTSSSLTTRAQYSTVSLRKRGTDEWVAAGDLT